MSNDSTASTPRKVQTSIEVKIPFICISIEETNKYGTTEIKGVIPNIYSPQLVIIDTYGLESDKSPCPKSLYVSQGGVITADSDNISISGCSIFEVSDIIYGIRSIYDCHSNLLKFQGIFLSVQDEHSIIGILLTDPAFRSSIIDRYERYTFSDKHLQCIFTAIKLLTIQNMEISVKKLMLTTGWLRCYSRVVLGKCLNIGRSLSLSDKCDLLHRIDGLGLS